MNKRKGEIKVPAGEEEAADGGEEEAGVKVRMDKVDRLKVVLDGRRHMVVDTTEGGYSGEILGSLDMGVNIEDREGPSFSRRGYMLSCKYFFTVSTLTV